MSTYNGAIAYPFEVLLHLLWSYVVFAVVLCIFLPAPLVLLGAFGGNGTEVAVGFFMLFAAVPATTFAWVHVAIFSVFRVYFAPRFPYAPFWVTLAIALTLGSTLLAAGSYVPSPFEMTLEPQVSEKIQAFAQLHFVARLGLSVLLTILVAMAGGVLLSIGGMGPFTYGLAKWLGWLIVGRDAYDAFVERERAKLSGEYGEYVKSIRKV